MDINGVSAKTFFSFDKDFIFANPGSFGIVPKDVNLARNEILAEIEKEPDLWYRYSFHSHFQKAADLIADTFNSPRKQLTVVENVTIGFASVLNSLELGPSDQILVTSDNYYTMVLQCKEQSKRFGVEVRTLKIKFPYTHESIVQQYEEELSNMNGSGRKIAVIDHITSPTALLMPLREIIRVCKRHGAISMVDAAHAPGQITDIDLSELQPDIYIANLYKWSFTPRSCGFLYVAEPFLDQIRPIVASWLHYGCFRQRFSYQGTKDNSSVACVPAALNFIAKLGGTKAIQDHARTLVSKAMDLLIQKIGAEPLCEAEFSAPMMRAFYLGPIFDEKSELMEPFCLEVLQSRLHHFLRVHAKIVCPFINMHHGRPLMRICAHAYTDVDDIQKLVNGIAAAAEVFKAATEEDLEQYPSVDWMRNDKDEENHS